MCARKARTMSSAISIAIYTPPMGTIGCYDNSSARGVGTSQGRGIHYTFQSYHGGDYFTLLDVEGRVARKVPMSAFQLRTSHS